MSVYSEMLSLMAPQEPSERPGGVWLRLGTVTAVAPLAVDVAGTPQKAARFYICDRLQQGHRETVDLAGGSGGFSANDHTHSVTLDEPTLSLRGVTLQQAEPVLKPGDLVLLLTDDDQTFFLIDKVVHL